MKSGQGILGMIVAAGSLWFTADCVQAADATGNWRSVVDRHLAGYEWSAARGVLEKHLASQPRDADAWRALGRLLRWEGRAAESRVAYSRASAIEPDDPDDAIAIAASHALEEDRPGARAAYASAAARWPGDADVQRAATAFGRTTGVRVAAFLEQDLTTRDRSLSLTLPAGARREVVLDASQESRPDAYVRPAFRASVIQFLGWEHALEFNARHADYRYEAPVADYTAIDSFSELRLRYARPLNQTHVLNIRYSWRPTRLETSGDRFAAHKLEASMKSQWTPRFSTTLGTGALRDLDGAALTTSDLQTSALIRASAEVLLTSSLSMGAGYITNPDLDGTVRSQTFATASLGITEQWSGLVRLRSDDQRSAADQRSIYLGARFSDGAHPLWLELGAKYVERGPRSGVYPLLSLVLRN